jgi:uncharacterized protein (DUF2235 family)
MANIIICADGTWNRPEEDIADVKNGNSYEQRA